MISRSLPACALPLLFLSVFMMHTLYSHGQDRKIVPASPEASSLTKMVNYPVSFNTGVPNISIPLYTIETGGMALPVDLSYHAGGFKINERATSVGLGWALTSDIQITRTVNGRDDFDLTGYINNSKVKGYLGSTSSSYDYPESIFDRYMIASGNADGMPDKFNYKLLNKSGSFYFRKSESGTSYSIVPVPFENIKISYHSGKFIIVDTDGTTYSFGEAGRIDKSRLAEMAMEVSGDTQTAWKCTTILNPTKTETVTFTYQNKYPTSYRGKSSSIEYYNNETPCLVRNYVLSSSIPSSINYEDILSLNRFYKLSSPKVIVNYDFAKSELHWPYLNSENQVVNKVHKILDLNNENGGGGTVYGIALSRIDFSGGAVVFNGAEELTSIRVEDNAGSEIKTISFMQSYEMITDVNFAKYANGSSFKGTLYLDSIQMKMNNQTYETYKLKYGTKYCFGSHVKGKDSWGHINYSSGVGSLTGGSTNIPKQTIVQDYYKGNSLPCGANSYIHDVAFSIGATALSEKTEDFVLNAGMLKRIVYPNGGYVDFDYESNMFRQSGTSSLELVGMSGGLRIRSINYFDGKSNSPVSQKYYRYGELEDGVGLLMRSPYQSFNAESRTFNAFSYSQYINYLTGPLDVNFGNDFAPVPVDCSSRSCLTLAYKEKKTTYLPSSSSDYYYPNGAPIYYTKVTEYNSDLGVLTGKKVYNYYSPNEFIAYTFPGMSKIPGTNIDVLETDGLSGIQKSIEQFKFEKGKFGLINSKEFKYSKYKQDQGIRVVYSFFNTICKIIGGNFSGIEDRLYDSSYDFNFGQYGIQVGKMLLNAETEKWVEGTDTLKQTTTYSYSNYSYPQVSQIVTGGSRGNKSKTFKYSYDYPGIAVYEQMKTNNMISQVIEEVETNNQSGFDREVRRTLNDYGFINNAAFIAPVSLRKSEGGNTLDTLITYDRYGVKANILQTTEKGKLVTSYLWGYSNKYPVAKITGAPYASITSLVDVVSLANATNEVNIKNTINTIRSAFSDAMVNTYTFIPLIGVRSETDPAGRVKSYKYDAYGRLNLILDHDNNIVKKIDYQITAALPSAYLNTIYYNVPRMQTFNPEQFDGKKRMVNFIIPGGRVFSYDVTGANRLAEDQMNNSSGNLTAYHDVSMAVAKIKVKLEYGILLSTQPAPQFVYLDLIRDGSVVATKRFPIIENQSTSFYIEEGAYTLSYRFDRNYPGSLYKVYMYNNVGFYNTIKSGSVLNFQPDVDYSFLLTNTH